MAKNVFKIKIRTENVVAGATCNTEATLHTGKHEDREESPEFKHGSRRAAAEKTQ